MAIRFTPRFFPLRYKSLLIIFIILLSLTHRVSAAEDEDEDEDENNTMDDIVEILTGLTCETQGLGNLLRDEFSHTCVPSSFLTMAMSTIQSPFYADTMLKLKINDNELFIPEKSEKNYVKDAKHYAPCDRKNRLDFDDPKLDFAFCSNTLLAIQKTMALAESTVIIAKSFLTGDDPWEEIAETLKGNKESYHLKFSRGDGDSLPPMVDPPLTIPWKVLKDKDTLCVNTLKIPDGDLKVWIPVGCKYIKEPYPVSIYQSFMGIGGVKMPDPPPINKCVNTGNCYQDAYNSSKAAIVITGPLIECIRQMLNRLMVNNDVCVIDNGGISISGKTHSSLFQFQHSMHKIVSALLTIYVILFGFKVLLAGEPPQKAEIINFVVKFIFVVYFSIGINTGNSENSTSFLEWISNLASSHNAAVDVEYIKLIAQDVEGGRMDGIVQWVFPFLLDGMTEMAGWVINSSPSGLCDFSGLDYKVDGSSGNLYHMQLWDALDCRVTYYLGLDAMQTMIVEHSTKHSSSEFDAFSFPIPPYVYLLIPAVISGNLTLISLAITYPLLVISVAAFVVNATVVCMISIVILCILAPVFVPLYLFDYTRGYFDSWVKLLLSFLLQPMVAVVFMMVMMSVYDHGFFGTCKYEYKDVDYKSTFPTDGENSERVARFFYVNTNWDQDYDDDEVDGCKNSLGFILNNPLQFLFDVGSSSSKSEKVFDHNNINCHTDKTNDPYNRCNFIKNVMPELDTRIQEEVEAAKAAAKKKKEEDDDDDDDDDDDEEEEEEDESDDFGILGAIVPSPGIFFDGAEVVFKKIRILASSLLTACLILYLMYHLSEQLASFSADITEGVSIDNMTIKPQALFKAGMKAVSAAGKYKKAANKASAGKRGGASDKFSTSGRSADKSSTSATSSDSSSTAKSSASGVVKGAANQAKPAVTPSAKANKGEDT